MKTQFIYCFLQEAFPGHLFLIGHLKSFILYVQHFSQSLLFLQYTSVSLTGHKERDVPYFFLYTKSLKHHKLLVKCVLNEKVLKTCTRNEAIENLILYKQNFHVENTTLPNLWQQAESKHNKMKITFFQALPELRENGGTFEYLCKCVFLIFYICEYVSLLFSQFWFPLLLKYIFSFHRENTGIYTPMVQSIFRTTVNKVSKIHSNYFKEAPKKCTISEQYNIFSN